MDDPLLSMPSRRKAAWKKHLPLLQWLPEYEWRENLTHDLLAGLTVGILAVPQSISYATVAGLPPVYGLYNAFVGMLPYPLLGTSPHLITGPTAVLSIIVKSAIPGTWHNQPVMEASSLYVSLALALSFFAGVLQVLLGSLNLGFIVNLVAEPVILGFTTASAFLIAGTQLASLFGIPKCDPAELFGPTHKGEECFFHDVVYSVVRNIPHTHVPTFACSVVAITVLCVFKYKIKSLGKLGSVLGSMGPLVVVAVALPWIYSLEERYGELVDRNSTTGTHKEAHWHIATTGPIEAGLPGFSNPFHVVDAIADVLTLFKASIIIALVGFMEAITIAKTVAKQTKRGNIRATNELLALGSCNLLCSVLNGFPVTGSFSRTAVNAASGGRSPIASVAATVVIGLVLMVLSPALQYMPKFVLGAIVIVSVVDLVDIQEIKFLWQTCRRDFVVFLVVFVCTLFMGVEGGLLAGILSNWSLTLLHQSKAHLTVFKQSKSIVDSSVKVVVVEVFHNLTFSFVESTRQILESAISRYDPVVLILNTHTVQSIDSAGILMLKALSKELPKRNVQFILCGLSPPSMRLIEKANTYFAHLDTGNEPGKWIVVEDLLESVATCSALDTQLEKCTVMSPEGVDSLVKTITLMRGGGFEVHTEDVDEGVWTPIEQVRMVPPPSAWMLAEEG